jgi:hypothetical protein
MARRNLSASLYLGFEAGEALGGFVEEFIDAEHVGMLLGADGVDLGVEFCFQPVDLGVNLVVELVIVAAAEQDTEDDARVGTAPDRMAAMRVGFIVLPL